MPEIVLVAFIMALGFGAYWAMVLFPRQRDFKKRQEMARALAEGDEIVTFGGIVGRVKEIRSQEGVAIVEIANGVEIRLVIAAMMQRFDAEEIARNAQIGQQQQTTEEQIVH